MSLQDELTRARTEWVTMAKTCDSLRNDNEALRNKIAEQETEIAELKQKLARAQARGRDPSGRWA